ncbi:hypothetical protein [Bradyrhizobium sp. 33ap4]|uniref:hypothetical protein n=1 Tax=Bradyrhizobium sp. 33ap4 TaxID=3061630 RepID=UPI0029317E14|nr:hypothetical protein [Bradyrhizobium sp. 33ap4]
MRTFFGDTAKSKHSESPTKRVARNENGCLECPHRLCCCRLCGRPVRLDSKATYEPGRQTDALERFEQFKPKLAQPEAWPSCPVDTTAWKRSSSNVDYGDELIDAGHEAGHHASGEGLVPSSALLLNLRAPIPNRSPLMGGFASLSAIKRLAQPAEALSTLAAAATTPDHTGSMAANLHSIVVWLLAARLSKLRCSEIQCVTGMSHESRCE